MPDTLAMTTPMTISNSEVLEFQKCERSHYYHYVMNLEPKIAPLRFDRGTTGHKALETLYRYKIAGADKQQALEASVREVLNANLLFLNSIYEDPESSYRVTMYNDLINLIRRYVDYYWDNDPIRPIEVETVYKIPINDRIKYGMKIDLLGEYTQYPYKGDIVIVDWKFRYNFITDAMLRLNPQLPKYSWGIEHQGHKITKGFLDIIRYRMLKENSPAEVFRRPLLKTKRAVREQLMELHTKIAERIYQRKQLPVAVQSKLAERNLSEMSCRYCSFSGVCTLELYGEDPTTEFSTNFKPSEYGYNDDEALAI